MGQYKGSYERRNRKELAAVRRMITASRKGEKRQAVPPAHQAEHEARVREQQERVAREMGVFD